MYKKILLAADGSPPAEKATQYALELAKLSGSEITAINAVYTALTFPKSKVEVEKEQKLNAEKLLENIKNEGKKIGVTVKSKIVEGPPGTIIVKEAEKGYDIIVMGSKGEGALGSVAEKVVRNASCSVLVCKI